jgi:DNA polymerase III epsilon subunit family exonuclease
MFFLKKIKKYYKEGKDFVAVDLETTGINPKKDEIIEVGAYKFNIKGKKEKYRKLVNPKRRIPKEVTDLTGITQKMVANKPSFSEIKEKLITFIGDSIILGWNLSFDLAFLERKGIKLKNQAYDVLKISKIILPKKKRNFKLFKIAKELGIKVKKCHRALPDAKILKEVFLKIIKLIK